MNIYLTIMVTVLVLTQVIRITQNAIQLHQSKRYKNIHLSLAEQKRKEEDEAK